MTVHSALAHFGAVVGVSSDHARPDLLHDHRFVSIPHLPNSLLRLLDAFRPCFSSRTFATFVALTAGLIAAPTRRTVCSMLTAALITGLVAAPARRTVCGMLTAVGLNRTWHHSRAHRFFATARWDLDHLSLTMLGLVVGWLTPTGGPLIIAIDDTLFRRTGRHVRGACWAYDGSRSVAAGQTKLSRGTTFVVAAVVVNLPFLERPIALPALFRLWRPGGPTKPTLARELIRLIAAARRDRRVHVVADGAYLCKTLRDLPGNVTLTGPLPRHAALWDVHPEHDQALRLRRRGRLRVRGERIGNPDQLAATTPGASMTVTRYGRTASVTVHERRCLWYGVFRSQPVRASSSCVNRADLPWH